MEELLNNEWFVLASSVALLIIFAIIGSRLVEYLTCPDGALGKMFERMAKEKELIEEKAMKKNSKSCNRCRDYTFCSVCGMFYPTKRKTKLR